MGRTIAPIDWIQKEKKESGKYLDKNWTKAKKLFDEMMSYPDCIMLLE